MVSTYRSVNVALALGECSSELSVMHDVPLFCGVGEQLITKDVSSPTCADLVRR